MSFSSSWSYEIKKIYRRPLSLFSFLNWPVLFSLAMPPLNSQLISAAGTLQTHQPTSAFRFEQAQSEPELSSPSLQSLMPLAFDIVTSLCSATLQTQMDPNHGSRTKGALLPEMQTCWMHPASRAPVLSGLISAVPSVPAQRLCEFRFHAPPNSPG